MQPPTWLLTGLAGIVIGIAGLGIGYELRGGGSSDGAAVTASEPGALPTTCAVYSAWLEQATGTLGAHRNSSTPIPDSVFDREEQMLRIWKAACR